MKIFETKEVAEGINELVIQWEKFFKNKTNKIKPTVIVKEEECTTCKRTKDLGKKCWWCGN